MLALVSIWTLSPDELETTPVWRGDSHPIGLQLKVHGRKRNGRKDSWLREIRRATGSTAEGRDRVLLPS